MSIDKRSPVNHKKGQKTVILLVIVLFLIIGIPYLLVSYQAKQKGMNRSEVITRIINKSGSKNKTSPEFKDNSVGAQIDFLNPTPVGQKFTEAPLISNVQAVDLDGDGLLDIVVCDCRSNSVNWIRQFPAGVYTETVITDGKLYIVDEQGTVYIIQDGTSFKLLAEIPLNDVCLTAPAITDGMIFFRTQKFLIAVGKK